MHVILFSVFQPAALRTVSVNFEGLWGFLPQAERHRCLIKPSLNKCSLLCLKVWDLLIYVVAALGEVEACGESCGIHMSMLSSRVGWIFVHLGVMNRVFSLGRQTSLFVKFAPFLMQPEFTDLGIV